METFDMAEQYKEIYDSMKTGSNGTEFDIHSIQEDMDLACQGIKILGIQGFLDPKTQLYGRAVGYFRYMDGRVFAFWYNIHTPESKGPRKSNTMTDVKEVVLDGHMYEKHNLILPKLRECTFGLEAFWYHTPYDILDDEAKALRALMKALQAYCRMEQYCKKLKKLDKVHLEWEGRTGRHEIKCNE